MVKPYTAYGYSPLFNFDIPYSHLDYIAHTPLKHLIF